MKIEIFREYVVLAKYLNYSVAAEYLHITQPVLSRHIAALEEEFGVKLLRRTTQFVDLTDAGEIFLERITKILSEYDDLKALMNIRRMGYEDCLRIGTPYYAMEEYLGQLPVHFETKYPEIKLRYEVGDPYEMLEMLLGDKVDAIIIPKVNFPQMNQMKYYKLFREPLGVMITTKDPLSDQGHCDLCDLKDKTFFSVNNDYFYSTWEHVKGLCRKAGFTPRAPVIFNTVEAAMVEIRQSDGVLIIGQHMKKNQSAELAFLTLDNPGCWRDICVWCKKGNDRLELRKFIELCKEWDGADGV